MKTRILNIILLLGIAIGGASCVFDDYSNCPEPVPEAPFIPDSPDMLTLCLNVSFDLQENGTRANDPNGNPPYEGPTGSRETISTLRVIIIRDSVAEDANGNPTSTVVKREVEGNRLVATSPLGYPLYDNLNFKVVANENKRIYLIANESSLTPPDGYQSSTSFLDGFKVKSAFSSDSEASLTDWTVSIPISDIKNVEIGGVLTDATSDGIFPSFEIKEEGKEPIISYPQIPLTEFFDVYVDSEKAVDDIFTKHLFITRAAAKATFYIDTAGSSPAYDNVSITTITLSGIGSEEYVFPNETEYSKGKDQTAKIPDLEMYINKFKTPDNLKTLTYLLNNKNFPVVDKTSNETIREIVGSTIYFPESILKQDEKYQVGVQLSTGVWLTAPLETKGDNTANILSIDGREAVARNTHLKITLKFSPVQLEATATVFPYTGVWLNPEFGFAPPETDILTVAPTMELQLNGEDGLLYPNFTSTAGNTIHNLYWVSSNPSIVLLGNEVTNPTDQRYVEPSGSIELPYLQEVQDEQKPVPVRLVPKNVGTATVAVYTESGLVARCRVTVSR